MGMRSSNARGVPASIELHIKELVLHGFAAKDRLQIGAAIEEELSRLIERHGARALPVVSMEVEGVMTGNLRLANGATPQAIGRQIAQHVHRQLSPVNILHSHQQATEAQAKP
jgi:hypothetical protein